MEDNVAQNRGSPLNFIRRPNVWACSLSLSKGDLVMLGWILTFLVIALIAGALGFGGIAGASAGIAQILFYVFLVLLLVSLVVHFTRGVAR
jgi:uncharacterized membrane protein YtjA (UPF0391 family)